VITDIYMLAFLICTLIVNLPIHNEEGKYVGEGIMLYNRGITREYISALKMHTLDVDLESDSTDANVKETRLEAFTVFFNYQWYYLLSQINTFVSLNIITNNDSYELFLVIRKRTVISPHRSSLARMNAAIKEIMTSTNSTLDCRLEILPQDELHYALSTMMFDTPVPRRLEVPFTKRMTEPELVNTMFRTQNGFITFLKIEIEKYVRSHPSQRINETERLDGLIRSLIEQRIHARYMFSIKLAGIEKIEQKEMGNTDRIAMTKVKDGFTEIKRNFEYLINNARISAGLFIFSPTMEEHKDAVDKVKGIIHSLWETAAKIERNPVSISMDLACTGVESLLYHVPCFILYRYFHFPRVPSGKQERRFQFQLGPPPDSVTTSGMLNIGKIIDPNGRNRDFLLGIDDIKRHVFINGTTGSGKSVFTRNLIGQIMEHFPAIPFLVLEVKGEYATLGKEHPGVVFLEPGINFTMNIFDPMVDVHVHAERVFNILKTSFDFTDVKDFSPQMEKVLVDLIITTCSDPDPTKRCFSAFFKNAQQYVNSNKAKIPYLESTWIGIENRLRRITTGPLRSVFDGQGTQDPINSIMKSQTIISLSNIVTLGGTKDDLYFVANLVLKMVWDANLAQGPSRDINHITFVDDAQYFSRTRGNSSARETNYMEDIALLLRGTGEVLIAISTRPDISEDVLSNCGLIVCFQTKFKEDVQKLKGLLHLPEEKASNLEILPEHTSVIKLNSYPSPFTLETRKPFPTGQDGKTPPLKNIHAFGNGSSDERSLPRDFAVYSRFFAKVKEYLQFKDRAWEKFSILSKSEMEDLEKKIRALRDEIGGMMHDHDDIRILVKNAGTRKSPDENLGKIRDELL
jgi:hypothetical protein